MTAERVPHPSIVVESHQPLVGVFVEDDSDLVEYFPEPAHAPEPSPSREAREALSAIGAWSDMDWDELATSLDRIRHESRPTPPIEL